MSARSFASPLESAWPQARAAEVLVSLARAAGLRPSGSGGVPPSVEEDVETLGERLAAAALEHDLEVDAVETPYPETEVLLERSAPALIRIDGEAGDTRLLALLSSGRRAVILAPDGRRVRCDLRAVRDAWCSVLEERLESIVTPMLDATGLHGESRVRARRALLREHLVAVPVGGAWIVRLPPGRPLRQVAARAGLPRLALGLAACGLGASFASLLAWVPLARGVLSGRFEPAWVVAWALLLGSALPLRWLESWLQSLFGLRFGRILRSRLMAGATRLAPEAVRGEGAGALLGRVLESEALELLLLSGGFVMLGAVIDVLLAGWVLSYGPTAGLSLALFALVLVTALWLARRHRHRAGELAQARLSLTHDLVERMTGQKTRVVQEPRERWHEEEDALLEAYLDRSRALDRTALALTTAVGGAWVVAGAAALTSAFVAGAATPLQLALGVGAILLGQQALVRLTSGLSQLSACAVAWQQVRPLYAAAAQVEDSGLPRAALRPTNEIAQDEPLLGARDLCFRHPGRGHDVLTNVDLELHRGQRVLVEGPSGGGKSTLVSLLTGWRFASSGSLTLNGLDRSSLGAARWRRQVAAAPQFHENYVFGATLAFNLLLASPEYAEFAGGSADAALAGTPPRAAAELRALEVCEELGLADVIERMPSGLRQGLGETGWQLSHGEQSRLFIARALLADTPLVVLDESLAALDPVTARQVLACVQRRAEALVAVAHP